MLTPEPINIVTAPMFGNQITNHAWAGSYSKTLTGPKPQKGTKVYGFEKNNEVSYVRLEGTERGLRAPAPISPWRLLARRR
jgi:hypothetical protein